MQKVTIIYKRFLYTKDAIRSKTSYTEEFCKSKKSEELQL